MNHSPEPWKLDGPEIEAADGSMIAHVIGGDGLRFIEDDVNKECKANAERIIACVNACKGIDNKTLAALPAIVAASKSMGLETFASAELIRHIHLILELSRKNAYEDYVEAVHEICREALKSVGQ